jgi:hypothetical protein
MPLTAKGEEILANLKKEYGPKKGEQVLYAGKNKGTFTGIDDQEFDDADVEGVNAWMDSWRKDADEKNGPGYNREAVQKAIEASRKPISPKEAKLIHALLKGRGDDNDPAQLRAIRLDATLDRVVSIAKRVDDYCARADKTK